MNKLLASICACAACWATSSLAEAPLSAEAVHALVNGNTIFVELAAGAPGAPQGGVASMYFSPEGRVVAKLPSNLKLVGEWALSGNGYCVDWEKGPQKSCSSFERRDDRFVIINLETSASRGAVTRIQTGNVENL